MKILLNTNNHRIMLKNQLDILLKNQMQHKQTEFLKKKIKPRENVYNEKINGQYKCKTRADHSPC